MSKPKSYTLTFTEAGKAWAEATSSVEAVEAAAHAEIADAFLLDDPPYVIDELPASGVHFFEMPDGAEFLIYVKGDPEHLAEIDAVARHESLGRIEDRAGWLGMTGEVTIPVGITKK